jgi:hypothetical protein
MNRYYSTTRPRLSVDLTETVRKLASELFLTQRTRSARKPLEAMPNLGTDSTHTFLVERMLPLAESMFAGAILGNIV